MRALRIEIRPPPTPPATATARAPMSDVCAGWTRWVSVSLLSHGLSDMHNWPVLSS